ncbi:MAG: helix-turn-helix transcriptional regulator [Ruminococcaceae bacterium]|nr:helix-turn-helix transcriptional regulator [Oscillospiraceae bacterium]
MRVDRVKLIAEMARQDIKVNELAKKAGISRNTVTALRSGKTCYRNTVIHVARALGVDPEELLKKEE